MEKKISSYEYISSIVEERIDEISDFELARLLKRLEYHTHLRRQKKGEESTFSPLQRHFI